VLGVEAYHRPDLRTDTGRLMSGGRIKSQKVAKGRGWNYVWGPAQLTLSNRKMLNKKMPCLIKEVMIMAIILIKLCGWQRRSALRCPQLWRHLGQGYALDSRPQNGPRSKQQCHASRLLIIFCCDLFTKLINHVPPAGPLVRHSAY
jgi:hypothetical protein